MKYYYILFHETGQETCYPMLIAAKNKKELIRRGYARKFVAGAERFNDSASAESRLTELQRMKTYTPQEIAVARLSYADRHGVDYARDVEALVTVNEAGAIIGFRLSLVDGCSQEDEVYGEWK